MEMEGRPGCARALPDAHLPLAVLGARPEGPGPREERGTPGPPRAGWRSPAGSRQAKQEPRPGFPGRPQMASAQGARAGARCCCSTEASL